MADQDHGLDDIRELARGLRENENPGREEVNQLRIRVRELSEAGWKSYLRADRLEAALERVREWAEGFLRSKNDRNQSVGREVLSLIEHGPDDGEPEQKRCTCAWGQKIIIHRDPDCSVHGKR